MADSDPGSKIKTIILNKTIRAFRLYIITTSKTCLKQVLGPMSALGCQAHFNKAFGFPTFTNIPHEKL
jgi:hypothetical protein